VIDPAPLLTQAIGWPLFVLGTYLLVYWPLRAVFGVLAEIARKRGPSVFVGLFWLWVLSAVLQLIIIPSQRARQLPMNFETLISVAAAWATSDVWYRRFHKPENVGSISPKNGSRAAVTREALTDRRPAGAAILSVILGWLALGGLVNAFLQAAGFFPIAPPSPWGPLLALAYSTSAGATAVGLWKMRRWTHQVFLIWAATVLVLAVWLWGRVLGWSLVPGLGALLLFAGLLVFMGRYTRRVVRSPT